MEAAPFSRATGVNIIRELRERLRIRQDELARAARAAGVPWTTASVAGLETGRRTLTLDEVACLPAIFRQLGTPPLRLDISADDDLITVRLHNKTAVLEAVEDVGVLGEVEVSGTLDAATGRVSPKSVRAWAKLDPESLRRWTAWTISAEAEQRVLRAWPATPRDVLVLAGRDTGVLEQRLARRFKVDVLAVAVAARNRWGQSATDERDKRSAAAVAAAGESRRVAQTLRGHATRQLIDELADDLRHPALRRRR